MKTDFTAIRKELEKLTDVEYLKKELNRVATEIKNFDVNVHLTPQARAKLRLLEKNFNNLVKRLALLQKQVDTEVVKFVAILRKTKDQTEARIRAAGFGSKKKTSKKTSRKKASRKKTTSNQG